jgi:hypothetical protein
MDFHTRDTYFCWRPYQPEKLVNSQHTQLSHWWCSTVGSTKQTRPYTATASNKSYQVRTMNTFFVWGRCLLNSICVEVYLFKWPSKKVSDFNRANNVNEWLKEVDSHANYRPTSCQPLQKVHAKYATVKIFLKVSKAYRFCYLIS